MVVWKFGSWISTSPRKAHFLFLMCRCHAVEEMTRNSNALVRDGSVMADSDLVDFLSGSTDSAINWSGSADLHNPIHPPLFQNIPQTYPKSYKTLLNIDLCFENRVLDCLKLEIFAFKTQVKPCVTAFNEQNETSQTTYIVYNQEKSLSSKHTRSSLRLLNLIALLR